MRYDSAQWGSFEGWDNRRELMILLQRLGSHLPEQLAKEKRADFLRRIMKLSGNGFAEKQVKITPCDPVSAYFMLTAITGVLGVPIDKAAQLLERTVQSER